MPAEPHILRRVLGARPRLAAVAAALAAPLAGCAEEPRQAQQPATGAMAQALTGQRAVGYQLFWAGETFEGHRLTAITRDAHRTTIGYGTCDPPDGEGGCAPPLQIQSAPICADNALKVALRPRASFTSRGTSVRDYGEGRLDLDASTSLVRVFARGSRGRRAVAALRPVAESQPVAVALPAARYPNGYLAELRRVVASYERGGGLRAVRAELGISVSAARLRLALARELGPEGLHSSRGIACDHPPG